MLLLRFSSLRHTIALAIAAASVAACSDVSTAPRQIKAPASVAADYGAGAVYQVEISANPPGTGFWVWAELSPGGTGDYEETDCIHLGGGYATDGGIHDAGSVSGWSVANGVLTMTGVKIIGGAETATISVPMNGHPGWMTLTVTSAVVPIIPVGVTLNMPAQVQVAP